MNLARTELTFPILVDPAPQWNDDGAAQTGGPGGAILFNRVGFDRRSFRIGPAQPMVHGQIRYQISRGQGLQLAVRVQIRPDGS